MALDQILKNAQDTFWNERHNKPHPESISFLLNPRLMEKVKNAEMEEAMKVALKKKQETKLEDDLEYLSIMKPIDPEVRKILYSSIPEARKKYLTERVELKPEDRFYHQEWSNVEYGWKMWDSPRQYFGFGRQPIIKNSFYRRNGVQRDPDWYREPNKLSPSLCGSL